MAKFVFHVFGIGIGIGRVHSIYKKGFKKNETLNFLIFGQSLSRHLPLKQGSESRQTLPKRVSDDSRHFIFRHRNFFFSKLRTAVYPPRMAPFGLKLWENAFQMIPDISFFDAGKKKSTKTFRQKIFCYPTLRKISKLLVLEEL